MEGREEGRMIGEEELVGGIVGVNVAREQIS